MDDQQKWEAWCEGMLHHLYQYEHAGFAILAYASTILERAIRIEIGMEPGETLGDKARRTAFCAEVAKVLPELPKLDPRGPEVFWGMVRNGVVHDLAVSKQDYQGVLLARLRIDPAATTVTYDGDFMVVGPRAFAEAVLSYVKSVVTVARFVQGDGATKLLPLPDVQNAGSVFASLPMLQIAQLAVTESHARKP